MSLVDDIRRIAADLFSKPVGELPPEASPETVEDWDSVQHLNLVLALEEKFEVQIDPEDLSQTPTLAEIASLVERKQAS